MCKLRRRAKLLYFIQASGAVTAVAHWGTFSAEPEGGCRARRRLGVDWANAGTQERVNFLILPRARPPAAHNCHISIHSSYFLSFQIQSIHFFVIIILNYLNPILLLQTIFFNPFILIRYKSSNRNKKTTWFSFLVHLIRNKNNYLLF